MSRAAAYTGKSGTREARARDLEITAGRPLQDVSRDLGIAAGESQQDTEARLRRYYESCDVNPPSHLENGLPMIPYQSPQHTERPQQTLATEAGRPY